MRLGLGIDVEEKVDSCIRRNREEILERFGAGYNPSKIDVSIEQGTY